MVPAMDYGGRWINQNGSVLELKTTEDGRLAGRFFSSKGRGEPATAYPVTGMANGEIVALVVSFHGARGKNRLYAATAFSGRWFRTESGVEAIHMLWVLARQFEDERRSKPTEPWNAFVVNTDTFTRLA